MNINGITQTLLSLFTHFRLYHMFIHFRVCGSLSPCQHCCSPINFYFWIRIPVSHKHIIQFPHMDVTWLDSLCRSTCGVFIYYVSLVVHMFFFLILHLIGRPLLYPFLTIMFCRENYIPPVHRWAVFEAYCCWEVFYFWLTLTGPFHVLYLVHCWCKMLNYAAFNKINYKKNPSPFHS